jgi:6-phospho 3-hexuloisomerase
MTAGEQGPRKKALKYLTEGIHRTIDSIDCKLTDELVRAVLDAERVFLYGAGRSGFVARCFAMRLGHLGIRVVRMSIDETDPSGERDLALIVSGTGETKSSIFYARTSQDGGSKVACITENLDGPLTEMCDIVIHLDAPKEPEGRLYAPMGTIFEDTCLIFLDTLVVDLMVKLGETEDTMRRRHGQLY